jgi:hypothetical protein
MTESVAPSLIAVTWSGLFATLGDTFCTVSGNVTWFVIPSASVAVIVTVWLWAGPSFVRKLQDQVPAPCAIVPTDAVMVTESPFGSENVPEFVAVCASFTVTDAAFAARSGCTVARRSIRGVVTFEAPLEYVIETPFAWSQPRIVADVATGYMSRSTA